MLPPRFRALFCDAILVCCLCGWTLAHGEVIPSLTWVTNSSVKLEQIIGDIDWAAAARGTNLPTVSRTVSRFHVLANGLGYSFEDRGKLIFLFGDTISEDISNLNYHGADPLAWSTNTDGESGLLLNFYTNNPVTNFTPLFVQAAGIKMGPYDVPNSGISLSNGVFLVCNTGSDGSLVNPQTNDFSVLVSFLENQLPYTTNLFVTNRVVSTLTTNLDPQSPLQGRFINVSMQQDGAEVMTFGTGEYRSGDVFLCRTPVSTFATGQGTAYFAGWSNGAPTWSAYESNCVPVVQDNPTNGPAWPSDSGTVGNVSVIHPADVGLWLMTYDGGRSADTKTNHTTGVYFTYAPQPWGPWTKPQLIFNKLRDHGSGVFIHDPSLSTNDGLNGPIIGSDNPTNVAGGDFAPILIERFTRLTNSTLYLYYTLSTWNPYTVVKMRSAFFVRPEIDPDSLVLSNTNLSFTCAGIPNQLYQVDTADALPPVWSTLPQVFSSAAGTFLVIDSTTGRSGAPGPRFYRVRSASGP